MSNSLDNLSSYYIPNTLDGINIISDEVSSNALLVDGTNFMLADLNMNNHVIKNLDAGIDANDAVNLSQLNGVSSSSRIYSNNVSSASHLFSLNVSSSSSLYTNVMANLVSSASHLFSLNVSSSSYLYSNSVSSSSFVYSNIVSSSSSLYCVSVSNNVSSSSKLYADSISNNVSSSSFIYSNNVSTSSYLFATSQSGLKVSKTGDIIVGDLLINAKVGISITPTYNLHVSGPTFIQGPFTSTGTISGNGGVFSNLLLSDALIVNTDSSLNTLSVTGSMTTNGVLTANNIITLNGGTATDSGVDTSNKINTYIKFGPAGADTDWAYLRQIGSNNMISMALDFHDDYDGSFTFRNVQSGTNPDIVREYFKITRTRGFYCPSGMYIRNTLLSTVSIELNNETGKFIVWVYGTNKLNGIVLPDTNYTDIGTIINVYNCTTQTLDVTTYLNLNTIYKSSGNTNITTLSAPQGAIFMYDGAQWIGCKTSISNF